MFFEETVGRRRAPSHGPKFDLPDLSSSSPDFASPHASKISPLTTKSPKDQPDVTTVQNEPVKDGARTSMIAIISCVPIP
jgi:hypothetical protein